MAREECAETIVPAIKDAVENVLKKDSQDVLKCLPLSATTVQRRIMADDVENTLTSELQRPKFSIQLDESTFGSWNLLMTFVRNNGPSLKCVADEFQFANYRKGDATGETIFDVWLIITVQQISG